MRLNTYVAQKLSISGRRARDGIDRGGIKVNGKLERHASYQVQPNDKVEIMQECFAKRSKTLPIIFEGDGFIAINKPPGVTSVQDEVEKLLGRTCYLVHRLDKETSGVLLLAITQEAKSMLESLFYKRKIEKEYLALVEGEVEKSSGKIESLIEKKREGVFGSGKKGDLATTYWERIDVGNGYSLIKCRPKTGRTHQLRVHLSEMNHPVVGDLTYGNEVASRMMLHAKSLRFLDYEIVAPLPDAFMEAISWIKTEQ